MVGEKLHHSLKFDVHVTGSCGAQKRRVSASRRGPFKSAGKSSTLPLSAWFVRTRAANANRVAEVEENNSNIMP
jgi:hypothetical protein